MYTRYAIHTVEGLTYNYAEVWCDEGDQFLGGGAMAYSAGWLSASFGVQSGLKGGWKAFAFIDYVPLDPWGLYVSVSCLHRDT